MGKAEAEAILHSNADKETLEQLEKNFSELHQQNQSLQTELLQINFYSRLASIRIKMTCRILMQNTCH